MHSELRQNEAVLACAARRGDREALRELLVRNWGWLKGLVYSVVGSGQDVDDCLQDIKIWKNLQQKQDFPGRLRAPNLEQREDLFERIEKQMRDMQARIEQLEKERGRNPAQEDQKSEEKESHEQESGGSQSPGEEKI